MILIYRKTDGVVVGENPDDRKATQLAEQYGPDFGLRIAPYDLNASWLETTAEHTVQARVWREWKEALWQNPQRETRRQAETPGPEWSLLETGGFHGEHIGDVAPGEGWQMTQDRVNTTDMVRTGTLSLDPATGDLLLNRQLAPLVETEESIDLETQANIRSQYSINEELKMARLARADPKDSAVVALDTAISHEVQKGRDRKASKGGML